MLSEVKQVTIVISGDVQLIGFRGYLEELAFKCDLAGFVYNDYRDGTVKFACEGEAPNIEELIKEIEKNPKIRVNIQDRILLPKPVGRVMIGIEKDIFDRLDLGIEHLSSINGELQIHTEKLGSIETTLKTHTEKLGSIETTLTDIKGILLKIAEK